MNNKDVIYIDIDDDITSVIDKIKSAGQPIVALVSPKRNNVLQSAVNLKLLLRKAELAKKRLVLVTSDRATIALAGSIGMYVAKNLQTKPEIPTISSVLDEPANAVETVIGQPSDSSDISDDDIAKLDANKDSDLVVHDYTDDKAEDKGKSDKKGKKPKVPNFEGFRKKILLISGGVILVIIAVIAFMTATGKTTVTIHGETSSVDANFAIKVDANADQTSPSDNIIKATTQELQKSATQTFTATGKKNIGQRASGTVTLSAPCSGDTINLTIPAQTSVTSGNMTFVTQDATTLSSSSGGIDDCTVSGAAATNVIASQPGGAYNLSPRSYVVSGFSAVSAAGSQMSGGTDQNVTFITQSDVDNAKKQLTKQDNGDIQKQLAGQFDKDLRVLSDTFVASPGTISVTPNVGDQASQGTVTAQYTYSEMAISNDDLNAVLDHYMNSQIKDKSTQRIYKNGFDQLQMTVASRPSSSAVTYNIATTGYIGPQFDEDAIKQQITGKKYGQIVSTVEQVPGVNTVDVHFSPFWSRKAGSPSRIQIILDVSKTSDDNS